MLAYSTNPSVRTEFSVRKEQRDKAMRIAMEVNTRRDYQRVKDDFLDGYSDENDLRQDLLRIVKKHLHAFNNEREYKLSNLIIAVVHNLEDQFVY